MLTGIPFLCPWNCRCSRKTSPWTAARRWQQRWTWRAYRRWGCWRRSSGTSPHSQTPPERQRVPQHRKDATTVDHFTWHRNSAVVQTHRTQESRIRTWEIPKFQTNSRNATCYTPTAEGTKGLLLHPQHKDDPLWLLWTNPGVGSDFYRTEGGPSGLQTESGQQQHPDVDVNIKHWPPLTLSLGSLLMVFSGLRTRSTRRDLMVFMSRPLLFLQKEDRRHEKKRFISLWICSHSFTGWSFHIQRLYMF